MNIQRLKIQEEKFLNRYPQGFQNPEMLQIAKKHNVSRLITLQEEALNAEAFEEPEKALDTLVKLISRSSLVSVFEKTAFKNHVSSLPAVEKRDLVHGFYQLLHGDQKTGFEHLVDLLTPYKMAKWTILTILLYYQNPLKEVVIKPTTVKGVIDYLELEDLVYSPKPSYAFYVRYREAIGQLKQCVSSELQVENGAFCGFLMFVTGRFE